MLYTVQFVRFTRTILKVVIATVIGSLLGACHSVAVRPNGTANSVVYQPTSPPVQYSAQQYESSNKTHPNIPAVLSMGSSLPEPIGYSSTKTARLSQSIHGSVLYTVIADRMPVRQLLYSLARDKARNKNTEFSIAGEINGLVSLHMVNQPMVAILDEVVNQLPLRFERKGNRVLVLPDKPTIRTYQVDYLNMQRISESRVDLATQVGSMRLSVDDEGGAQGGTNGSRLFVENKSENRLWDSLMISVAGIIKEKVDLKNPASENIFINREAGLLSVRAIDAQHRAIDALLSDAIKSAHRQVLIEATVVEVTLDQKHESGVDWRFLQSSGAVADNQSGNSVIDAAQILGGQTGAAEAVAPSNALFTLTRNSSGGAFTATLKLLEKFGDVQVLSRPKIIAMNNQPAVLKVVDNRVYFTFEVDRMQRENGDERTVVDSTVHSVPVGLVMNVTPFISHSNEVILNVRPTISRILNFAEDPSPALAGHSQIKNLIPEIQVREMESLLKVSSGDVAIIGGLMQNRIDNRAVGVPLLSKIPGFGKLFSQDTKALSKTELLVFLRPTVTGASGGGVEITVGEGG